MPISEQIRKELACLARNKGTRTRAFTKQQPTKWKPYEVKNQSDTAAFIPYFSDDSAWHFIADLLESGHEVETIILDEPPGATGYVMHIESGQNQPRIYVKLQLGQGAVIGRSFHYDE